MADDILSLIRENVIQGRVTEEDEGMDEGMVGQPGVIELVNRALEEGMDLEGIVQQGLTEAMETVGQKFEAKEYFIPDMLASAEAVGAAMDILRPHLARAGAKLKGEVVLATVKDDLHDIGKSIVSMLLQGAGYMVEDLGTDVSPEAMVAAVREKNPAFLGMSALLTSTMVHMKETIDALKEAGLRDKVKVLIGGAPTSEEFAHDIGADAYGADAFHAVSIVEAFGANSGC